MDEVERLIAEQEIKLRKMKMALETIIKWQFPEVPDRQRPGHTISYGFAYGSNGERDYMINIAREALK